MKPLSPTRATAAVLTLLVSTSGCGLGYNRVMFFTKSNVGLDVDPTPPTLEATIARREGVIEPAFENGKTLPVLASFSSDSTGASRLLMGSVGTTFATGEAAVGLAKYYGEEDAESETAQRARLDALAREGPILVSALPKGSGVLSFFQDKTPFGAGEMEPLIFGTDSAFGLKVGTSGQVVPSSPPLPTLVFGFRRKEVAFTPVMASQEVTVPKGGGDETLKEGDKAYLISMPSLLATMGGEYSGGTDANGVESGTKYVQYFATGRAATYLSLLKSVRNPLVERLVPDVAAASPMQLDQNNRVKALDLYDRTGKLTPDSFDGDPIEYGDTIRKLHEVAVAVGHLAEPLASFEGSNFDDELAVNGLRDELANAFLAAVPRARPSKVYTSGLDALLALVP